MQVGTLSPTPTQESYFLVVLFLRLHRNQVAGSIPKPLDCCRPPSRCMLRRKSTRITLKPEDREEYFAHKQATKPSNEPTSQSKEKPTDKEVRIGLKSTR